MIINHSAGELAKFLFVSFPAMILVAGFLAEEAEANPDAERVYVDAPEDLIITSDVAPLGGIPTTGDTVTWSSPKLGTKTGAVFGTDAFGTIQEGVDAVCDGGIVFVADGTYTEAEISIGKSVTFFGDDEATTALDGGGAHHKR